MSDETVLLAEDDSAVRMVVSRALSRQGYRVQATSVASALWRWVADGEGDIVITDVGLPDENSLDLLPKIKSRRPDLPVIVMSAQNTLLTAVRATERGAFEYLPKPFDIDSLVATVQRALTRRNRAAAQMNREEMPEGQLPIIGRSAAMQEIYRVIARLTGTDLTVLIAGESGTGKELVARALHDFGRRRDGPFVAVNMAAIPRELIESELFGHEKGSFTGASGRRTGRFEQAQDGTLFLDEIGDMPLEAQTRLLRVLQQGEFVPVGGDVPHKTNVRIIAASHRDLKLMVEQGLFREDLYYRLNVVPLRLPPLRERFDDIAALAHHFLAKAHDEGLPLKTLTPGALRRLRAHSWPGNVRELENLIRRVAVLYSEETIDETCIVAQLVEAKTVQETVTTADVDIPLATAVERHLDRYLRAFEGDEMPTGVYQHILSEVEGPLIRRILLATRGNQLKAADILGLNRNTLRKKIKEHDIQLIRGL
ncbi:MAG: nitrogen regulation protein NR(I) [Geminicoccaceae bacterium]|nr:nitrogen regulation protein NR(I) [Geminicoccaceae bacterium]